MMMRILLSTIGSRGDVQPLVALGLQLKELGQDVRLCVPPDFREWIEGLGLPVTPIGPELRSTGKSNPMAARPTPEQIRQMMEGTVATQFETITDAAKGCDLIVGATALQIAAPSIAEKMGIPYFFAAYCPAVLPSPRHAPPVLPMLGDKPMTMTDYSELWTQDAQRWNTQWRDILNSHRTRLGLAPVSDVRSHILTDQPWLASDPMLGPWDDPEDKSVFQTGAWIVKDERPLDPELESFLDAGEPPIFFGFGSISAPQGLSQAMIASARALGRRAILLHGWADLSLLDNEPDCIAISEANYQLLFKRVAAIVHHGGAGTTHAATRSGAPQVVIPQHYDQPYWAGRVQKLGIGVTHTLNTPTVDSLTNALEQALQPDVIARAQSSATEIRTDGALIAAQRLMNAVH
ncbi:MAG TPA: glycosyltransferase [Anaerolineales bacterium]|nr:glycosyltransferase [Anaerolineales bacterium]